MSRIEPATQIHTCLNQERPRCKPFKEPPSYRLNVAEAAYRQLIAGISDGTAPSPENATIALPSPPILAGRRVHSVWPATAPSTPEATAPIPAPASRASGPALRGADGRLMQLPAKPGAVYTLLQTQGSRLNGRIAHWSKRRHVLDQLGLLLIASEGYSRIHVQAATASDTLAHVNGIPIQAGQSIRLADGGVLHAGRNGRHIYIHLPGQYSTTITRHQTRNGPLLDLRVSALTSHATDGEPSRTGLLAQSFQTPLRPRSVTRDGELYRGPLSELEVAGSLYGASESSTQHDLIPSTNPIGSLYQHYFDLDPQRTFGELGLAEISNQWEWINQQSVQLNLIQNAAARQRKLREYERKQELLLSAALKGGNIDLAILLLSAAETQSSNDLTRRLVRRIHQLQQQRQGLSAQMAQVGEEENASGSSQLQSLVTQASNIATEISLLQTFLQDAVASKRNIQEFASNWIQQSHQTTRSIIQSIGR